MCNLLFHIRPTIIRFSPPADNPIKTIQQRNLLPYNSNNVANADLRSNNENKIAKSVTMCNLSVRACPPFITKSQKYHSISRKDYVCPPNEAIPSQKVIAFATIKYGVSPKNSKEK